MNLLKKLTAIKLLICLLFASGATAGEHEPSAVVDAFHAALLQSMSGSSYQDRVDVIQPVVKQYFQPQTIARISLGRNWRSLSADQQSGYQALIEALIVSTYASRFTSNTGQVFSILATEPITADRVRVRTRLETTSETVSLDYQLQQAGEAWRIYDIVANGVSDLSLKRSNYSAIYKKGGLESVEQEIRSNIAENQCSPNC